MINKLFTWLNWDALDTVSFVYEDIRLIPSIGQHPPNSFFSYALVNFEKGTLTLGQTIGLHNTEWTYSLTLHVGELIQEPTP